MFSDLTMADESEERHPPDLALSAQVFELAFHPTTNLLAAGLVTGEVDLVRFTDEGNLLVAALTHHKESCRAVQFSALGTVLFTGSRDKTLCAIDVETRNTAFRMLKAHTEPINALLRLTETLLASGDDGGVTKIWDLRAQKAVREYADQSDFVSDYAYVEGKDTLLATSGDGTLAVYDPRYNKAVAVSDQLEDELLSVAVVKNGTKVVCGTQDGILDIYSWGQWADISDRFPGHPSSIDSLAVINEELLLTASSDGLIRVVSIHPNELMGIVGEHADFPIERIKLAPSHKYLASCSHDDLIKFWNVEYLFDPVGSDEEEDGDDDAAGGDKDGDADSDDAMETDSAPAPARRGRPKGKERAASFFADL